MFTFKKKPVIIEARRLTTQMEVLTLEGIMRGSAGDWLIKGVEGEKYICKDAIFRQTYEPIGDDAQQEWGREV